MAETEQAQEQAESQETSVENQAQEAELTEVQETEGTGQANLDVLLDISMPITVNIGRTEVPFRKVLQLGPEAVMRLDKPIDQPADLYIQDIRFATGDIVVVDGCFAVRIREVLGMDTVKEAIGQ